MDNFSADLKVSGSYEIKMHTPVSVEFGILNLTFMDGKLSGSLINRRGANIVTGGTVEGNELNFDTNIRTPMGKLKTHVTATIEDSVITGTAKLPLGSATIEGKKKQ
jgi:hypothetical protein